MTREHLWSTWMDKANLLPRGGEYVEFRNLVQGGSRIAVRVFTRVRQGSAATKKIKVVCKECNERWMSKIEDDAKPLLTPLITGGFSVLDAAMQTKIMEWITLKVLVADKNSFEGHPADPIYDQPVRDAFKQGLVIPEGFTVWITAQTGAKWVIGFHRHASTLGVTATLPPPPSPPPGLATLKNVQVITWGIGKLLIHLSAISDRQLDGRFALSDGGPLLRLWPLSGKTIVWPPRYFVSDAYIDDLSEAMERFLTSGAVILPQSDH
jgi:hypothetical protein